ncbi:MAG: hypothetical protein IJ668_09935 [Selenomonadaceae bacterium]|nr:hypothetical protein [Selenomonadaceae bacterium]
MPRAKLSISIRTAVPPSPPPTAILLKTSSGPLTLNINMYNYSKFKSGKIDDSYVSGDNSYIGNNSSRTGWRSSSMVATTSALLNSRRIREIRTPCARASTRR